MKKQRMALLLLGGLSLGGCVSVRSNQEPGQAPSFQRILVVAKQKTNAQRYADSYRFAFPAGYQVTTLGIDDLTFGAPDSLVRREVAANECDAVLWLETRPSGTVTGTHYYTSTDFEMYAELRSWPTNRPFWKMRAALPAVKSKVSPERVIQQLKHDGILRPTSSVSRTTALSPKNP